ncbi:hypothetical protein [Amycolatopsis sp. NPDC098790]|uniref:hypothetical protein n=1 Tax=Amycolatopsis sp. NPDC098790 TaxID=3363939 RepID=UPI003804C1B0
MKVGYWGDDPELLSDNSDKGVIRVQRLQELGVPATTAYRRCGPGGPWTRLLPGIVLLSNAPPTHPQRIAAAFQYCGPEAILTGTDACRVLGLRNVPEECTAIQLLVPHRHRRRNYDYVQVERTHRLPKVITRRGLRVAEPSRAVLDGCRQMSELRPVRALLTEAVQRSFTTWEQLNEELANGSQRGSAVPRLVLAEMAGGAESVAELDAVRLWKRSGLPEPKWNKPLFARSGAYIAKPDAWFDQAGLAWEIDSVAFHADAKGFARTLDRNARYAAAGVLVLPTLPSRLRTEPEAVIVELKSAYAAAAALPKPNVRAVA